MLTYSKDHKVIQIINLAIGLFPISYIFGNLILNVNILLIIILGIRLFQFEIFRIRKQILNILFIFFFFYLIFITIFNNLNYLDLHKTYTENIVKSFLFLRYLLLLLIINKLAENKFLNLKYLFFSSSASVIILGIDIFIQAIFGADVFGYKPIDKRLSGFFGDELIAGGFLQLFSYFLIFSSPVLFSEKNKINFKIYFVVTSLFIFIAIILTNNRMPFLLFLFGFAVLFLIERKIRKLFIVLSLFFLIFFTFLLKFNPSVMNKYQAFYNYSQEIVLKSYYVFTGEADDKVLKSDYLRIFNSATHLAKQNLIAGNGIKSFRVKCKIKWNHSCSNHPHNYYLEILLDTGLIGLLTLSSIFFIIFCRFINFYKKEINDPFSQKVIYCAPFLTFCTIVFPIKSSGSFFSTNNAAIIFLILAIVSNINNIKSDKKIN